MIDDPPIRVLVVDVKRLVISLSFTNEVIPMMKSRSPLAVATRSRADRLSTANRTGRFCSMACFILTKWSSSDAISGYSHIMWRLPERSIIWRSKPQLAAFLMS